MSSRVRVRVSTIAVSGTTRVSSSTLTTMPSSTASVSGSEIEKVVPLPGVVVIVIRPPSEAIAVLTTSMPTPRPDRSETSAAVEKPGRKISLSISPSVSCCVLGDEALLDGLGADALAVDAGAVVGDLDDHAARAVAGGQVDRALGRLAGGDALVGGLEPVIDGVADHVRQRLGQPLDHRLVDLGRLALGLAGGRPCPRRRRLRARSGPCAGTATSPAARGSSSRFPGCRASAAGTRRGPWRRASSAERPPRSPTATASPG